MAAGIRKRHSRRCRSGGDGRCTCTPTYEAWLFSRRDNKNPQDVHPRGRGEVMAG